MTLLTTVKIRQREMKAQMLAEKKLALFAKNTKTPFMLSTTRIQKGNQSQK